MILMGPILAENPVGLNLGRERGAIVEEVKRLTPVQDKDRAVAC